MRPAILLLVFIFHVSAVGTAEDRYVCTIERGYSLGPSGLTTNRRVLAALETRSFEIDRQTGVVSGSSLQNARFNPTVVAPGNSDNSFQVYWIVRGSAGTRVRFIEVQEFAETPRKPFRAVVQNWTYTGHCD